MIKITKYSDLLKKVAIEMAFLAGILIIDLVSKALVFDFLADKPNHTFVVLDKIFTMIEAKNYGASFSILEGKQVFLVGMTSIVMLGLVVILYIRPNTPSILRVGLLLIIGGGIGNLVDRVALGYVRDFIDYTFLHTFFGINFAIGNIADVFLCVGVVLMLVYIVFEFDENDFVSEKRKRLEQSKIRQTKVVDKTQKSNDTLPDDNKGQAQNG
ncbi:MAG: signal peptidase II [Clostridia bacterium]